MMANQLFEEYEFLLMEQNCAAPSSDSGQESKIDYKKVKNQFLRNRKEKIKEIK